MPEKVILPVLSWKESEAKFGSIYPNSKEYMGSHYHPFGECGHVRECPWPWQGEHCQAFEHWDEKCWDCLHRPRTEGRMNG